jgi:hypothetical protein
MARLSIVRLLAYILGACGGFIIVNALAPQITAMVPGGWMITLLVGIVLVVASIYIGRR